MWQFTLCISMLLILDILATLFFFLENWNPIKEKSRILMKCHKWNKTNQSLYVSTMTWHRWCFTTFVLSASILILKRNFMLHARIETENRIENDKCLIQYFKLSSTSDFNYDSVVLLKLCQFLTCHCEFYGCNWSYNRTLSTTIYLFPSQYSNFSNSNQLLWFSEKQWF